MNYTRKKKRQSKRFILIQKVFKNIDYRLRNIPELKNYFLVLKF